VKVAVEAGSLKVEGPLGKLEQQVHPAVGIEIDQAASLLTSPARTTTAHRGPFTG